MLYPHPSSSSITFPLVACDRPYSTPTFREDLRDFITMRLNRFDPYQEIPDYRRYREEAERLFKQLRETVSGEALDLLIAYDDALAAAHGLEMEMMGERGFYLSMKMMMTIMIEE